MSRALFVQPCHFDEVIHMTPALTLSPLFSTTVGFDRLDHLFGSLMSGSAKSTYPAFDVQRMDEDHYRIRLAVPGLREGDLEVTVRDDRLVVQGNGANEEDHGNFLYRGITMGRFERSFQLADYVVVQGAELRDGLLTISLARQIPEDQKPRQIEIRTQAPPLALESARKTRAA